MPLDGGEEHQLLVQRFLRLLDEEFDQLGDFLRVRQLTLIPGTRGDVDDPAVPAFDHSR